MATAIKEELGVDTASRLAGELIRAWPEFSRRRFTRGLGTALEPLPLMARSALLADRLVLVLPLRFAEAAEVMWRALDSATFTGWMTLPCGVFVALAGIDHPRDALPLLAGLTPRWSSEFALRPFIERHPDVTFDHLHAWVHDSDEHVRRLVSEGTRPRLPWAPRLRGLVEDPTPTVALLDRLVNDPSAYVRRSVANHLNDIAKDHPELALDCARRWQAAGDGASWVVRHGLRTLVKHGDPSALALLGIDQDARIRLTSMRADRERVVIGDDVTIAITLELDDVATGEALIDYRIHHAGIRGPRAPKVFKLSRRRLTRREPMTIEWRHRFENVSVRRIHAGPHTLDVQVNGRVLGSTVIEVDEPPPGSRAATRSSPLRPD